MFNYIACEYPLPELPAFVEPGHKFQTKDTEPLQLETHRVDPSGRIDIDAFTQDIEFYTYDEGAAERISYAARFVGGRLVRVARST